MPTYVYRCKKGHTFELFHAISDETAKRCPQCRSLAKRVPAGGSGLLFKGSGFYITDYRSKGYRESAKQESGSTSGKAPAAGAGGATGAPATPAGGGPGATPKGKSERGPHGSSHGTSHRTPDRTSDRSRRKPDS
jgi:putative FmdB family regulatory protein